MLFAYYFKWLGSGTPMLEDVPLLNMAESVFAVTSGDRALLRGSWNEMGTPEWSTPDMWPFPRFRTGRESKDGLVPCVRYSEEDLLTPIETVRLPVAAASALPETGVADALFVENVLRRRIR